MATDAPSEDRSAGKQDEALLRCRPRRRKGDAHYVYLIVSVALGVVKVGHSARPKGRLSEMQVGSAHELRLCHTWALERPAALALERQMHAALAWASERGEWFRLYPAEAACVGDLFVAGQVDEARRLAGLLREQYGLEAQRERLRRAWYNAPRDRRAEAEKAAKLAAPAVERRMAEVELAQAELGLWRHADRRTIGGRNRYQWLVRRARAA